MRSAEWLSSRPGRLWTFLPFAASAMDGYAVRSEETPGSFPVEFRIAAGAPAPSPLTAGKAMAIATGGAVPEGADAVVPIEHVEERDGTLAVPAAVEPGANVRPRGGDITEGLRSSRPASGSGPPKSAPWAQPAWMWCRADADPAWPS